MSKPTEVGTREPAALELMERQTKALESIAESLKTLAYPMQVVRYEAVGGTVVPTR